MKSRIKVRRGPQEVELRQLGTGKLFEGQDGSISLSLREGEDERDTGTARAIYWCYSFEEKQEVMVSRLAKVWEVELVSGEFKRV